MYFGYAVRPLDRFAYFEFLNSLPGGALGTQADSSSQGDQTPGPPVGRNE
jgi:hypothetical protein